MSSKDNQTYVKPNLYQYGFNYTSSKPCQTLPGCVRSPEAKNNGSIYQYFKNSSILKNSYKITDEDKNDSDLESKFAFANTIMYRDIKKHGSCKLVNYCNKSQNTSDIDFKRNMSLKSKVVHFFDGKSPKRSRSFADAKKKISKSILRTRSFNIKQDKDMGDQINIPKSKLKKFFQFLSPSINRKHFKMETIRNSKQSFKDSNKPNLSDPSFNSRNAQLPYIHDLTLNDTVVKNCNALSTATLDYKLYNSNYITKSESFSDKMLDNQNKLKAYNKKQYVSQMFDLAPIDRQALINKFFDKKDGDISKPEKEDLKFECHINENSAILEDINKIDKNMISKDLEKDNSNLTEFGLVDILKVPFINGNYLINNQDNNAIFSIKNVVNEVSLNNYESNNDTNLNSKIITDKCFDKKQTMALLRKNFLFPNAVSINGSAESLVQNYSFKSESKSSLHSSASIHSSYVTPSSHLFNRFKRGSTSDYYPRLYQDGRINYTTPQRSNIGPNCPYPKNHEKQAIATTVNLKSGGIVVVKAANLDETPSVLPSYSRSSSLNIKRKDGVLDSVPNSDLTESKNNYTTDCTYKSSIHSCVTHSPCNDININNTNVDKKLRVLNNFSTNDSSGEEDVLFEKSILSLEDVKNRNSYYMLTSTEDIKLVDDEIDKEMNNETKKDGKYYLSLLKREDEYIKKMCAIFEKYLYQLNIPEDSEGKIRSATGQGKLLITKKFKQFKDLCLKNLMPEESQPSITDEDLAGFWDLTSIEVENVRQSFTELQSLRQSNWVSMETQIISNNISPIHSNLTSKMCSNPRTMRNQSYKNSTIRATPKKKVQSTADSQNRQALREHIRNQKNICKTMENDVEIKYNGEIMLDSGHVNKAVIIM